jgi:hypothetical protein
MDIKPTKKEYYEGHLQSSWTHLITLRLDCMNFLKSVKATECITWAANLSLLYFIPLRQEGAGIAQWYSGGLRFGWSGVGAPVGVGNFSLHHRVQNGSWAHPASYPMGTRGPFPGGKAAGAWTWPLSSTQCWGQGCVGLYLHSPNTPLWRGTQLNKADNFTFTLHQELN